MLSYFTLGKAARHCCLTSQTSWSRGNWRLFCTLSSGTCTRTRSQPSAGPSAHSPSMPLRHLWTRRRTFRIFQKKRRLDEIVDGGRNLVVYFNIENIKVRLPFMKYQSARFVAGNRLNSINESVIMH